MSTICLKRFRDENHKKPWESIQAVLLPIDSTYFLYPLFKSSQQGGSIIRCYLQLFEDTHIYLCTPCTELPKRAPWDKVQIGRNVLCTGWAWMSKNYSPHRRQYRFWFFWHMWRYSWKLMIQGLSEASNKKDPLLFWGSVMNYNSEKEQLRIDLYVPPPIHRPLNNFRWYLTWI